MASFVWQGISLSGKRVSGVLEADSKADVLKNLRKQKIRITLVQEQAAKKGMFSRPKKIKVKDLGLFTRQFATMISAGLPLIQCLEVLAQQMDHPELRSVISQVTPNRSRKRPSGTPVINSRKRPSVVCAPAGKSKLVANV